MYSVCIYCSAHVNDVIIKCRRWCSSRPTSISNRIRQYRIYWAHL